jgi:hypothetical protein
LQYYTIIQFSYFFILFVIYFFIGSVLVIRYEGPKGSPGMPEMLSPGSALVGAGLGNYDNRLIIIIIIIILLY